MTKPSLEKRYVEEPDDKVKVEFMTNAALEGGGCFSSGQQLESELRPIIDWIGRRSADEVNDYRLGVIARIEKISQMLWENGEAARWLQGADGTARRVSSVLCVVASYCIRVCKFSSCRACERSVAAEACRRMWAS